MHLMLFLSGSAPMLCTQDAFGVSDLRVKKCNEMAENKARKANENPLYIVGYTPPHRASPSLSSYLVPLLQPVFMNKSLSFWPSPYDPTLGRLAWKTLERSRRLYV